MVTKAVDEVDNSVSLIENGTSLITEGARKDIENFAKIVVSLGPESILDRGFAIARDDQDKPLTSRAAAMNYDPFHVQFRKGRVADMNTDRSGGDEQ
jgi:exonuclease VII large subunit